MKLSPEGTAFFYRGFADFFWISRIELDELERVVGVAQIKSCEGIERLSNQDYYGFFYRGFAD